MHRFVSKIVHNQQVNHAICGQLGIGTVDKCTKRTMPPSIQKVEGGVYPTGKVTGTVAS
jgi:hypothetical protein